MNKTVKIFEKTYHGFESLSDFCRDMEEAVDPTFNSNMEIVPEEFNGKIKVTIEYTEKE